MAQIRTVNNLRLKLASGITAGDTLLSVQNNGGALLPTFNAGDYMYATLADSSNNLEIVRITAKNSTQLTVVRGQDGTAARAYLTGDNVDFRPVAAMFDDFQSSALKVDGSNAMLGDLSFSGTGRRIKGDLSNASRTNRLAFQNSNAAQPSTLAVIPGAGGVASTLVAYELPDPDNSSGIYIQANATASILGVNANGTGTVRPFVLQMAGQESIGVSVNRNVSIAAPVSLAALTVNGAVGASAIVDYFTNALNTGRVSGNSMEVLLQSPYTATSLIAWGGADVANSHYIRLRADAGSTRLESSKNGTGTYRPLEVYVSGTNVATFPAIGGLSLAAPASGLVTIYASGIANGYPVWAESVSGNTHIALSATGSVYSSVRFMKGGVPRWDVGLENTAESGGNAGSNFFIDRFNDDASTLSRVLTINRSTGSATFGASSAGPTATFDKRAGDTGVVIYDSQVTNNSDAYFAVSNGQQRWFLNPQIAGWLGSANGEHALVAQGVAVDTASIVIGSWSSVGRFLRMSADGNWTIGAVATGVGLTVTNGGIAVTGNSSINGVLTLARMLVPGTGAVERALVDYAADLINVKSFGAVGGGAGNDGAAIQLAINYAQSIGGGKVYLPRGVYRITGTLDITSSGVHLCGDGIEATELLFDNGSANCIYARGTDSGAGQLNGFSVKDMSIKHGTKTGGRTIIVAFAYKALLSNLYIENCWCGIEGYVTNNLDLFNINVQLVLGGASAPAYLGPAHQAPARCYGLFWHAPADGSFRSDALRTYNVTVQANFSGANGFLWDGAATTWDAFQTTALACYYGMHIRNTGASASNYPVFGEFANFNTDGAMLNGLRIEAGAILHFTSCNITNTSGASGQGNADTHACHITADSGFSYTRAVKFTQCWFGNNRTDSVSVAARDVQFTGCTFNDGGKAASNTYSGLVIASGAEDVLVTGCSFSQYGATNNYKHGITVQSGTVRVLVNGNYIYNALTAPINWSNTDSYSRCLNNVSTANLNSDVTAFMNPTTVNGGGGNANLTGAQTTCGLLLVTNATSVTMASAAAIVGAINNPMLGGMIPLMVINTTGSSINVTVGSGVSINGNYSGSSYPVAATSARQLWLRVQNATPGAESIAAFG